jgi:cyclohexanone monooxygenase
MGVSESHEVLVVGAGFAGVHLLHRLGHAGFDAVLVDEATAPGGIWHWNCYPGARVDSHVPIYEFSDEAVWKDWYWDERFPDWSALRRYFDHAIDVWKIRDRLRLGVRVESARWREPERRWDVRLSDEGRIEARFLALCTGFAAKPYVPDIPGLEDFRGPAVHTARWPQAGLDLTDLSVGVIGTGASGVQVIQEAAAVARHVSVFQRTPILALPMQQRSLTRSEQDVAKLEYPARFTTRRRTNSGFDYPERGSSHGSTSEQRRTLFDELWEGGGLGFWAGNYSNLLLDESFNREAYEYWRERTLERIADPALARLLAPSTPPHPFGVKRPSLEQRYYEAFAQDNVTLVDVRSSPIEGITTTEVCTADGRHPLDVLVLATGFDAVTGGLLRIDLAGCDGVTLQAHWDHGVRTHLGVASHGFPNAFYVYGPQSPSGFCNGPTCAETQGEWLVDLLDHLRAAGVSRIEAQAEAEDAWREQVAFIASMSLFPRADSWYMGANVPGKPREMLNWPGGLQLYLAECEACADAGYAGFDLGS